MPTLVVEIISPSNVGIDRRRKRQLYARYAVPYYWIVDPPTRTVEALPPFPDLILAPRDIWPGPG